MLIKKTNISRKNIWEVVNPIPNVRRMKVVVSEWDKLFIAFGIKKRRTKAKLIFANYRNGSLNRYVSYQIQRLQKTTNDKTFWRIATSLMLRSRCFFIITLNHVFPLWYREIPFHKIMGLRKKFTKLVKDDGLYKYKMVEIPKANGKTRKLSVPTPVWRLYLHLLYCFLFIFMKKKELIHDNQHGFVPGRGTTSAWQFILKEVIHAPNIYEFDLKDFFPSIYLDGLSRVLLNIGIPSDIVERIINLNRTKSSENLEDWFYGLHQGSALSPLLSSLPLTVTMLNEKNQGIMYADDGLLYGNSNETPKQTLMKQAFNININFEKSGWVKKDNKWLTNLKFLGLCYNGLTNELSAHTRNGSRLIFDKENLINANIDRLNLENQYIRKLNKKDPNSWESLFSSRLWGFIQSRLYQGDWNLDEIHQCFDLTYKEHSYVDKYHRPYFTIHNASSYACHDLINCLRNKDL